MSRTAPSILPTLLLATISNELAHDLIVVEVEVGAAVSDFEWFCLLELYKGTSSTVMPTKIATLITVMLILAAR